MCNCDPCGCDEQLTEVQVAEDIRLCALHMDVGSEFFADVSAWALERGVDLQPGDPDQPWRNGVVEGRWRDVQALSVKAQLDVTGAQAHNLWLPTVQYAVHMANIQPTSAPVMYARPHSSPYERLTGEAPQSSWFFKFGEPCWFKDPSRVSKSTPKGVAGYIMGFELLGDRHHRRGFNVLPGDWESTRPTHRRLMIRANISRDTLATVPPHVGSEYMQPGRAGNPEGVTFSNAPDHPRNRRQARVPPVSCEAPEQQQVPAVEFPAGTGAPVVTNERAGDDQDAPLRDQEATHRAQQHISETQTAQEADAHGHDSLSDVVETSELDAPDAPSVGEAGTEAKEFQARGVESELADGEFVDAQDDSFLLQGLPEQDVEEPSAFGDADPRDLPTLAGQEEAETSEPEPPRRSSHTTAGVPPSFYGHHALPSNPEAGYEALDASKQSSAQRELLAAISAATTETSSGTMLSRASVQHRAEFEGFRSTVSLMSVCSSPLSATVVNRVHHHECCQPCSHLSRPLFLGNIGLRLNPRREPYHARPPTSRAADRSIVDRRSSSMCAIDTAIVHVRIKSIVFCGHHGATCRSARSIRAARASRAALCGNAD